MYAINQITITETFNEISLINNGKINPTKLVNLEQLTEILENTTVVENIATFASIIQLTEVKTLKKCRITKQPFISKIFKLSAVNVILNSKYEKQVLNQLAREDKEQTEYKKGTNTMPLIKGKNNDFFGYFNDKAVIEYRPNPNENNKPKTAYFELINDKFVKIEKSEIPDVLPIVNHATNQGTDKEILWRKLYVSNIVAIKLNGITYQRI